MRKLGILSMLLITGVCLATPQVVTLSIEVDNVAKTFRVFATDTNDGGNYGISAFEFNVWADAGATVTGLTNEAPQNGDIGFGLFRNDGQETSPGNWYVSCANATIYSGPNNPSLDAKVLQRIGQVAGSVGGCTWGQTVLLASGTYEATAPSCLHVTIPNGSPGFSLLKNVTVTGWKGPGNEMAPDSIVPGVAQAFSSSTVSGVISYTPYEFGNYPLTSVTINIIKGGTMADSHPFTLIDLSTPYSFETPITGLVDLVIDRNNSTGWFGNTQSGETLTADTTTTADFNLTHAGPGDADMNGTVDEDDYNYWFFGYQNGIEEMPPWTVGDFDGSGAVDEDDYNYWFYGYQLANP